MTNRYLLKAALAAASVVAFTMPPAQAQDDPPLGHWTTPTVTISSADYLDGKGWRIDAAVRKWNQATNGRITLVPTEDHESALIQVEGKGIMPGKWGEAIVWGFEDQSISHVEVNVLRWSVPRKLRHRVVLHELGHALGLGHTDSRRSVMGRNEAWTTISGKDIWLFNQIY